ncbi:MAG: ATP-binding cassette domain-containing protein [Candidatus Cloacimonetes bacterium]|nr:ATP-binding cassette domain-containing protein [Candidatus Cloacimonadota bacterium]MCF7813288.1 ATP-binding cassette domain-containing protein [Candidatus Cloacimonadota bacterium]MCF7867363.1 ATP-binding cassette domain-containing protein [Candidatus Cloacimonadota bacterium]MCF7882797.1 ATP-binding cassette domain-containing protein [Candidatus Cloacimonadota bacterium]
MIEVQNLSKMFVQKNGGELFAVNDLSFRAHKGEIVVLLGVNGAGKTTTMRMLSTVLQPTGGTALVEGFDILKQAQNVRANLGFLSGDTGLYARLSAREVITYFGRLYDVSESDIKLRIQEMADLLDMHDFLDKKIDLLSTGMKQKVSIARSIIHDPPVMIFDEPTAGLDILTAKNIVNFIHHCKEQGKCVLFSTHIMREAERIADKIVMIHEGKLLVEGTWENFRKETGLHDLDDIFIHFVNEKREEENESE